MTVSIPPVSETEELHITLETDDDDIEILDLPDLTLLDNITSANEFGELPSVIRKAAVVTMSRQVRMKSTLPDDFDDLISQ